MFRVNNIKIIILSFVEMDSYLRKVTVEAETWTV